MSRIVNMIIFVILTFTSISLQTTTGFEYCAFKFKISPGFGVKIMLPEFHYLLLLDHLTEVLRGIDVGIDSIVTSPLRNLLLAILGYNRKPFFVTLPRFSNCVSFLKVIETILDGFMSIYTKSALSPCSQPRTIALCLTVPVVNFCDNGHQRGLFRFISNEDFRDKMDVEVNQCLSVPLGDCFSFKFDPSSLFLINRFQ
jgi:hypothetical protein